MPRPQSEAPRLRKRDNGKWYAAWYNASERRTQQLSMRTENIDEAKARFAVFLSEGGDVVRGAPSLRLTVADGVQQYLTEHANVKCADPVRQRDIAVHLKGFFGTTPYCDIDIPLSRAYANWRTAAGAAPSTIRRELGMLIATANHAIRWQRMPADHRPMVEYPEVQKREVAFFTPDEIGRLMAAADARLRAYIVIAYFTAARRRSIETLEMSQVDLQARQPLAYLHKAGAAVTVKRRAVVPLNAACVREIQMLIAIADDEQKYLFGHKVRRSYRDSRGKHALYETEVVPSFYRPFRALCEKLGFGERRSYPHLLRHSRATHLLQDGKSVFMVANLLGDTPATVQRTYGHHTPEHAAGAVSSWDEGLMAVLK